MNTAWGCSNVWRARLASASVYVSCITNALVQCLGVGLCVHEWYGMKNK